jgi:hypothetical protein
MRAAAEQHAAFAPSHAPGVHRNLRGAGPTACRRATPGRNQRSRARSSAVRRIRKWMPAAIPIQRREVCRGRRPRNTRGLAPRCCVSPQSSPRPVPPRRNCRDHRDIPAQDSGSRFPCTRSTSGEFV